MMVVNFQVLFLFLALSWHCAYFYDACKCFPSFLSLGHGIAFPTFSVRYLHKTTVLACIQRRRSKALLCCYGFLSFSS
jgi:hypothetical protein